MGFFKRGKSDKKAGEKPDASVPESSPQKVGVVSGVLSTTAESDSIAASLFPDVVARRFGPDARPRAGSEHLPPRYDAVTTQVRGPAPETRDEAPSPTARSEGSRNPTAEPARRDHLRAVEPLFPVSDTDSDNPAVPELEVDSMAHIGRTTLITGDIVADEDLEIQGTIEGSVRLANHQVTVGIDGQVKASVDAQSVHVMGRITGNVVATDLVEVEAGGIIGGDVKAPRIIMHDGAIIVGGLDMSASLPKAGSKTQESSGSAFASRYDVRIDTAKEGRHADPPRPALKKVERPVAQRIEDEKA